MPKRDRNLTPEEEEEEIAEAEEEATIEKYEKLDEEALEEATEEEESEETEPEPIDPEEEIRQQKKRIYDKIEAQVDLSEFWQEVLLNPQWSDTLRVYYRIVAGLVLKHYGKFTVEATVENGNIVWEYHFFDKDGKEIFYDAENEEGVKE